MDEHQTRMLSGLTGLGGLGQPDSGDPDPVRKQQDIGDILQQIMAITDESLDEAQARYDLHKQKHVNIVIHEHKTFNTCTALTVF